GAEALEKLEAGAFDLLVLDLMMPVVDGATLKKEFDARQLQIPVILVSASRDLRAQAEDLAVADWIAKPFDFAVLEAKIARLLVGTDAGPTGSVLGTSPSPGPQPEGDSDGDGPGG